MVRKAIASSVLMVLTGCGTINNVYEGPVVYGGLRSLGTYGDPMSNGFALIDAPCSLVFDTAILPFTLLAEISRGVTGWPPAARRVYRKEFREKEADVKRDLALLREFLARYKDRTGAFPTTKEGLKCWRDPWGNAYVYRCPSAGTSTGYDLFSCGPDGKPDTQDDIWE